MPRLDRAINYLELTVRDVPAAKAFYAAAFGWSFTDFGPDYASFAAEDAGLDGGFTKGDPTPGGPLVVLYADDLDETQTRIKSAGGRITRPTYAFPGGRRFHFADGCGNESAVWGE